MIALEAMSSQAWVFGGLKEINFERLLFFVLFTQLCALMERDTVNYSWISKYSFLGLSKVSSVKQSSESWHPQKYFCSTFHLSILIVALRKILSISDHNCNFSW